MAVGAFVGIAIWAFAIAPVEPSPDLRGLTITTSGGTTGIPGYIVTIENSTGECLSTGAGPGYSKSYAYGNSAINIKYESVSIESGGTYGNPMPQGDWGNADCDEEYSCFEASFEWTDGGTGLQPPDVLVVEVKIHAGAEGEYPTVDTGPSGSCDVGAEDYDYGYESAICDRVEYFIIEDPGTEPSSIIVNPTAFGAISEQYNGELQYALAGMSFQVTCYNLRVEYEGVLDPKTAPKAMIGQKVRAKIDLDQLNDDGATYDWEVTGEGQFDSYTPGTAPDTTYVTDADEVELAFAKPNDPASFTCTVDVGDPDPEDEFTIDLDPIEVVGGMSRLLDPRIRSSSSTKARSFSTAAAET